MSLGNHSYVFVNKYKRMEVQVVYLFETRVESPENFLAMKFVN